MPKQDSPLGSKLAIYLAGSIRKGHEPPTELFWTEAMAFYLKTQYASDLPMQSLPEELKMRIHQ